MGNKTAQQLGTVYLHIYNKLKQASLFFFFLFFFFIHTSNGKDTWGAIL